MTMRFRRPAVKYAATPEPATPLQKAGQVWDDRLGGARVQARNWRLMAFGCLLLAAVSTGDRLMRHAEGSAAGPYLVERACGEVQSVSQALPPGDPGAHDIANPLPRFLEGVLSLATDPAVVRKNR